MSIPLKEFAAFWDSIVNHTAIAGKYLGSCPINKWCLRHSLPPGFLGEYSSRLTQEISLTELKELARYHTRWWKGWWDAGLVYLAPERTRLVLSKPDLVRD